MTTIGIIGGSGLYALDGLGNVREREIATPFGPPSDVVVQGELGGVGLAFVPRHGRGHRLTPSEVPYRANLWALKSLGVEWLVSVSAVGSMRDEIAPGHFVVPDQYIDRTYRREASFFGDGVVAHVSVADPTCPSLRAAVADAITASGVTCHQGGTYVCIEGPAFSTRAESHTYRGYGVSVIGMTAMPEAKLAREAELHYATIALATDYDCWHQSEEAVSAEAVLRILQQNTANVKRVLQEAVRRIAGIDGTTCTCATALAGCVITAPEHIPPARREALGPLLERVLPTSR